jgi:hypothetical protein
MSNIPDHSSVIQQNNHPRQIYGDKYQDHLLEQYKLYIEMMDRNTTRRNQTNSFYTSLLSGLLAIIAIATNKDVAQFQNIKFQAIAFLAVSILGILLCVIWYINIQSYKQLNSSKFKVISELEKQLPIACYNKEWEFLKNDNRYKGYLTQTSVERIVPFILAIPYTGLLLYALLILK